LSGPSQSDFILFGDGADATPGVAPSTLSSWALFTQPFVSTGVEDVGVEATAGADDAVSRLLAFVDTLRRTGAFGFAGAFPLGDLGICGDGAMIPGVAACGVGVETVGTGGRVDTAVPGSGARDRFFRCPGWKGVADGIY
jgi:hypothetical protein